MARGTFPWVRLWEYSTSSAGKKREHNFYSERPFFWTHKFFFYDKNSLQFLTLCLFLWLPHTPPRTLNPPVHGKQSILMNWGFEQATWKRFLLDQLPCKLCSCEANGALSEQSAQSETPTERGWRCTDFFPPFSVHFAWCAVLWRQTTRTVAAVPWLQSTGWPATSREEIFLPQTLW